jgi:hypothetical protein
MEEARTRNSLGDENIKTKSNALAGDWAAVAALTGSL